MNDITLQENAINNDKKLTYYNFFIFIFNLIICGLELYVSIFYYHQIKCHTIISPYLWLIVDSIDNILILIYSFFKIKGEKSKTFKNQYSIILMFKFAWIIIGAVIFWRDCNNKKITISNITFWVVLIISFIGLNSYSI